VDEVDEVTSMSEQQLEDPYLFHNRSDPDFEMGKQIRRVRDLIRVGDLVRIGPNGLSNPTAVPTWHRNYIGEIGMIVGLDFSRSDSSIYKILLGSGIILDKVHLLDFVVIQPVSSNKQPKRSKRR
jgi:hypothetical protein